MASETLANLLGVSPDTPNPNAYQVLGLRKGESDPQRIADAVAAAVRRLKQRREETPAEAWNEAAAAVKQARKVLSDPVAKAAYDDRLRQSSARQQPPDLPTPSLTARAAAVHDPLAGVLPTSNPFAPFDLQRAAAEAAKPLPFQPPRIDPLAVAQPNASVRAEEGQPTTGPHRRRSTLPWTPLVLCLLGMTTLGGIAAIVYVQTRPEPVAVGTNPAPGTPPAQRTRSAVAASEAEQPAAPAVPGGPAVAGGPFAQGLGPALAADAANRADGINSEGVRTDSTEPDKTTPTPSPANAPVAAMQPDQSDSLAEKRQAGEQAYQQARQSLMTQDWAQIKSLAEQAKNAAADAEQTQRAARLHQLALLADYYHGGIVRALEGLDAGDSFELSDDPAVPLTVAVVEADAGMLQIRFNGRDKSYAFDQIPLVLVHKIARFTMDLDSPTGMAAKAAYQAVCGLATPAHRQQSIQWLSQIEGEIQGANAEDLRAAIEQLGQA